MLPVCLPMIIFRFFWSKELSSNNFQISMLLIKSLDHEKHKKNRKTLPKKVVIVEDTTILSAQEVVAKSPEKRDGL